MQPTRNISGNVLLHRSLLVLCVIVFSVFFVSRAYASQDTEHYKIAYLLNAIGSSNLVFVRNGKKYTSKEAEAHLQLKLDSAGENIHTVEDFINNIASKSSLTGMPYYVQLADGTQMEAEKWLHTALAGIKDTQRVKEGENR